MSRSFRKCPVKPWTKAGSMKEWRTSYNQKHRHNQKQLIHKFLKFEDWDDYLPRVIRDDSNVYDSPRDGSWSWWNKPREEEAYNPYTKDYNDWNTEKVWSKIFRK